MNKAKWLLDISSYTDAIPYGNVSIQVERVNRRTTQVTTVGEETLRYADNKECLKDLLTFITTLLDDNHTGDVQFGLDMKQGQITLLTIKNTKKVQYEK
jgi:hypothetical protein